MTTSPSALESIIKGPQLELPPRIILLGEHKIGKSTFASKFPKPIFITVRDETGVDALTTDSFPPAGSYEQVIRNLEALVTAEKHPYKTLVLDSSSAFEKFLHEHTLKRLKVPSFDKVEWGQGFNETKKEWHAVTKLLDRLREQDRMTCIIIGHVVQKTMVDIEQGLEYSTMAWDLQKTGAGFLHRWSDLILYAKLDIRVERGSGDFGKKIRTPKFLDSTEQRVLCSHPHPARPGGGRGPYGILPEEIKLDYEAFCIEVEKAKATYNNNGKTEDQPTPTTTIKARKS